MDSDNSDRPPPVPGTPVRKFTYTRVPISSGPPELVFRQPARPKPSPAVHISPPRRKKGIKGIYNMLDAEVWGMKPDIILSASSLLFPFISVFIYLLILPVGSEMRSRICMTISYLYSSLPFPGLHVFHDLPILLTSWVIILQHSSARACLGPYTSTRVMGIVLFEWLCIVFLYV